ncbi:MAG: DUF3127 domain-containing protein [Verrucomicrobia bacterium]|nr:DUF3127 domain-containing protein [Verrucomicrobiota bacterium]
MKLKIPIETKPPLGIEHKKSEFSPAYALLLGTGFFVDVMAYELSGTVKEIFDEQRFDSGFNKRAFVVTSEADKFLQDIQFECLKERVEFVEKFSIGDKVNVSFDVNGREWNGKYFVNLVAWKIDSKSGSSAGSATNDDEPPLPDPDEDFDQGPPF